MPAQRPLDFDPVERAGMLWERTWPEEPDEVYASMRAVTSIMRAQQILLAELDAVLRPYGISFSRYEALVLLAFSRTGALPLSTIGQRLQVHATSVTNVIDRLEGAGLVRREPNPRDGRGTLAVLTDDGRRVAHEATADLNRARFGLEALSADEMAAVFALLRRVRRQAGDWHDGAADGPTDGPGSGPADGPDDGPDANTGTASDTASATAARVGSA